MTGPQLVEPLLCRHCWLSPFSWASFAPAVKHVKRKHILSPYGKGQGGGGEQVLAPEVPRRVGGVGSKRCLLLLSTLVCSRNSQDETNLLHDQEALPKPPWKLKVLRIRANLSLLLNAESKAQAAVAGRPTHSSFKAKTQGLPLTTPPPNLDYILSLLPKTS